MSIFISKQLKYFMVAMEKKCISKAADELYLTRTPLCKKLVDLENVLGEILFIRKYNELIPTKYAVSLHKELMPIYEAQSRLESRLSNKNNGNVLIIFFDISIPEFIYRSIISSIQGEITQLIMKFQRTVITEQLISENAYAKNVFFILLRPLIFSHPFKEVAWHGSEVSILMPKHHLNTSELIEIYVWNDGYINHFKDKIEATLQEKYRAINFISHNYDITAVLHKLYRGKGACILPLKTAMIYKNESLGIKLIPSKQISVYMYWNECVDFKDGFERTKQVVLTFI